MDLSEINATRLLEESVQQVRELILEFRKVSYATSISQDLLEIPLVKGRLRAKIVSQREFKLLEELIENRYFSTPDREFFYRESAAESILLNIVEKLTLDSLATTLKQDVIQDWWGELCQTLALPKINVTSFVLLQHFSSTQETYELSEDIVIHSLSNSNFAEEYKRFFTVFNPYVFEKNLYEIPAHQIKGVLSISLEVDFMDFYNDTYQISSTLIDSANCVLDALRISNSVPFIGEAWLHVANPSLPLKEPLPIIPDYSKHLSFDSDPYILDDNVFHRVQKVFPILERIQIETKNDTEENRKSRNVISLTLNRLSRTYREAKVSENLVDFVVILEALYSYGKNGNSLLVALASSNLLGGTNDERLRVFNSVLSLYKYRNSLFHGDPISESDWRKLLLQIAEAGGYTSSNSLFDHVIFANEFLRSLVTRSVFYFVLLWDNPDFKFTKNLVDSLVSLHLKDEERRRVHLASSHYPLDAIQWEK